MNLIFMDAIRIVPNYVIAQDVFPAVKCNNTLTSILLISGIRPSGIHTERLHPAKSHRLQGHGLRALPQVRPAPAPFAIERVKCHLNGLDFILRQ